MTIPQSGIKGLEIIDRQAVQLAIYD